MKADLILALAGNANVGKSSIFNQLTGLGQIIGNWPGKTVEKAEGMLFHDNKHIKIIDLPGIYSLSTYSQEEIISREYIALKHPDVVVNVVDATALERNLFFTLQLLEMGSPLVIALNLVDITKKKGITIDEKKLSKILNTPVIPTVATKGLGVHEIVDAAIQLASKPPAEDTPVIRYGPEVETRIEKLQRILTKDATGYPPRWTAIKLLEGDSEIIKQVNEKKPDAIVAARILASEISEIHKESCPTVIASERYAAAARIVKEVRTFKETEKPSLGERIDALSMHGLLGYVLMFTIMLSILLFMSFFGAWFSETIENLFESVNPGFTSFWGDLFWNGGVVGLYATLAVAFGFILPFYLILGFLEDSGYLPKVAYLMDRPCHTMGLHGKACIPLLLAFGCNVPACVGCRIMETKRDRFIAIFLSTLVPCSARTVVILGLVGAYVGVHWALLLYVFDFLLIFLIGRLLNRFLPGTSIGIIMEMPPYRLPSAKVVLKQAWNRFKPFLLTALPLIVLGSVIIEAMRLTNVLILVSDALSPVTVLWLGLPAFTGFLFIFGILRKEAALVLLMTAAGTTDISSVMSPVQMIVFALVIMIYVPCVATIAALIREIGWKRAGLITFIEIGLAILIGGLAFRILSFFI
ncbi:MAG: ferrous iron transport protein B [Candidatus Thermoplasmatota archaeon]|nr:ferrous iron transport protein B [Candidatus Thermoplasmatota archaeon]